MVALLLPLISLELKILNGYSNQTGDLGLIHRMILESRLCIVHQNSLRFELLTVFKVINSP